VAKLALSRDLLSEFDRLEKQIRAKVTEIAGMFQRMSAQDLRASKGINLEPYRGGQRDERARTIRITDNFRGIVCDLGDDETFVLHKILPHQDADRWMMRNEFRANVATGALEVLDVEAIAREIDAIPSPTSDLSLLYAHRKDKDFTQLGISEDLIPVVRLFTTEDQLQGLLSVLPQTQADALILLTGDESVEKIYAEIAGDMVPGTIAVHDLAGAIAAPASQSLFHIVESEDELQEMLARPLAQWRTFLHHSQRELAYRPVFSGPARVTGGPGTGKTVVAMHRAKHLAEALDDRTGKPILFTTFTRNLAEAIERDLRELGGADLLDVVEVLNVDALAHRLVKEAEGSAPSVIAGEELLTLWDEVADEVGGLFRGEFLANEWEQVIIAQACRSRDDYLRASRSGRGVRLDRRSRAEVWRAVETFLQRLVERNQRTFLQMADAAAGHVERRTVRPYQHVIVDEAQDLHESQWRMLRAVVAAARNDLFIVGDSHQRIYDRRTSLSKVGINIRGRSRRLRINYRTTFEILRWALALLGEEPYDDLDEGTEEQDLAGYHSFLHGPEPTMAGFPSKRAEYEALVGQLTRWIDSGVPEEDIAVCARSGGFDAIAAVLKNAGILPCILGRDLPKEDGVRLGTMHRLKGIEFRCVAVIDADDDSVPAHWDVTSESVDPVRHLEDLRRERCVLYVACTRARDDLWIGWSGRPSRFLAVVGAR
jgi:superfamily I DNA/RNA helicase